MAADDSNERVRRRYTFHGRVQGVFFRATSVELSRDFDVVGFVRNLPDGSVEMELEGPATEIDALLAAIKARYADGIARLTSTDLDILRSEAEFRIRY